MSLYNPYGSTAPVTYGMLLYQIDALRNYVKGIYDSLNFAVQNNSNIINNNINQSTSIILSRLGSVLSAISSSTNAIQQSIITAINSSNVAVRNQIIGVTQNINSNIITASNNIMIDTRLQAGQILTRLNDSTLTLANYIQAGDRAIIDRLNTVNASANVDYNRIFERISASQSAIVQSISGAISQSQNSVIQAIAVKSTDINSNIDTTETAILNRITAQSGAVTAQLQSISSQISTIQSTPDVSASFPTLEEQLRNMTWFVDPLKSLLSVFQVDISKSLAALNTIFTKLQTNQYDDYTEFTNDLNNLGVSGGLAQLLWDFGKFAFMATYGLIASYKPFADNIETLARSQANSQLLSPEQILRYYYKIEPDLEKLNAYLNKLGYSDDDIRKIRQSAGHSIPPDVIRLLYLQDIITEEMHDLFMSQNGFDQPEINFLKRSYHPIPPAQDLITMAVREAFTPEIADKYGQYENYPTKLTKYMQSQGISETWSKAYWASHWKLPSPEQGFEMFHRGIINEKELSDLLRALDVMPHWRDKLIQLNYDVLRLVDIRRFYQLGVINEEQIFKEFKARGYDDERAKWAVEYTVKSTSSGSEFEEANRRLLSQSVIIKAYKAGKINHNDAIFSLKQLRYTEEDANLLLDLNTVNDDIDKEDKVLDDNRKRLIKLATDGYQKRLINRQDASEILLQNGYTSEQVDLELQMTDYEANEVSKARLIDFISELYTTYQIDTDGMASIMASYGFEQGETGKILNELNLQKEFRGKLPTLDTFRRWLKDDIIDLPFFVNGLKGLGLADNYIDLYAYEIMSGKTQ